MSTLLIEIGCEELPYRICESIERQLEGDAEGLGLVRTLLVAERLLSSGEPAVRVLITPRRIAVLVADVLDRQTAQVQDFRGPKAEIAFDEHGELTKAGQGFARSRGAAPADVRREVIDGTEFAVVRVEAERREAVSVLPGLVSKLLTGLQIPRGMRWGRRPEGEAEYARFSRPVRWLVCKLGALTIEGSHYGLSFGDLSQGHRALGAPVVVDHADRYEQLLREQCVIVSQHERRRLIEQGLAEWAARLGGEWSDPGGVLAEAVYLAEWPSVASGGFNESYLRLPDEVLITAMQSHQRYFPVHDGTQRLLPTFLFVSNGDPQQAELISRGNERVLAGRLDDAEFAYDHDLNEGLQAMATRLSAVAFHEKLGSLADKTGRLQGLVAGLAAGVEASSEGATGSAASLAETLREAARLAKADLVSQLVIEFPSLQGVMGGLYASSAGLGEEVARAIGEHYRPLSTTAPLPSTEAGALLAVADKVDNIVGAWVTGQRPTGSRDPYGLRRAAMGIVRIALTANLRCSLAGLLASGLDLFEIQGVEGLDDDARRAEIVADASAFIVERLQVLLLDEGVPFPSVEAALAAPVRELPGLAARARAFAALVGQPRFEDAVAAYNRCAALAAKRAEGASGSVDPRLFAFEAERELQDAYEAAREPLADALSRLAIEEAVNVAAGMRPAVDRYFDDVLVMDEDPAVRANRLAQLAAVAALIGTIGEFSRLPHA